MIGHERDAMMFAAWVNALRAFKGFLYLACSNKPEWMKARQVIKDNYKRQREARDG